MVEDITANIRVIPNEKLGENWPEWVIKNPPVRAIQMAANFEIHYQRQWSDEERNELKIPAVGVGFAGDYIMIDEDGVPRPIDKNIFETIYEKRNP